MTDRRRMCRALRLHHVHRPDQLDRPRTVAEPPTGHAIGLGDAVKRQRPVEQTRLDLGNIVELKFVVDDVLVNVVRENPHMRVTHQDVSESADVVPRIGGPSWIGRRVEHKPLGLGRNRRLELFACDFEVVVLSGVDDHRLAARQHYHVGI